MGTYQSKYTGQEIDNGINPVGNIISFMGTIAPNGYLICDGSEVNVADYPKLATHFETQFGSKNYFGGDGSTTFAVPDLRNEFLRGYGDLSGEIGVHQDATQIPYVHSYSNQVIVIDRPKGTENNQPLNMDTTTNGTDGAERTYGEVKFDTTQTITPTAYSPRYAYTARPTNVAVLYCIKY